MELFPDYKSILQTGILDPSPLQNLKFDEISFTSLSNQSDNIRSKYGDHKQDQVVRVWRHEPIISVSSVSIGGWVKKNDWMWPMLQCQKNVLIRLYLVLILATKKIIRIWQFQKVFKTWWMNNYFDVIRNFNGIFSSHYDTHVFTLKV